jgi:hypothetical protein
LPCRFLSLINEIDEKNPSSRTKIIRFPDESELNGRTDERKA